MSGQSGKSLLCGQKSETNMFCMLDGTVSFISVDISVSICQFETVRARACVCDRERKRKRAGQVGSCSLPCFYIAVVEGLLPQCWNDRDVTSYQYRQSCNLIIDLVLFIYSVDLTCGYSSFNQHRQPSSI